MRFIVRLVLDHVPDDQTVHTRFTWQGERDVEIHRLEEVICEVRIDRTVVTRSCEADHRLALCAAFEFIDVRTDDVREECDFPLVASHSVWFAVRNRENLVVQCGIQRIDGVKHPAQIVIDQSPLAWRGLQVFGIAAIGVSIETPLHVIANGAGFAKASEEELAHRGFVGAGQHGFQIG